MTTSPLIFSGIQPTGSLHLGNYLGAIKPWVSLQRQHPCIYCVVDLHAITIFQNPDDLLLNTREVTAALIAAGIDTKKHILFNQSRNPHHTELAWIFSCIARMGWLSRMTQFKEKTGKNRERASLGLFAYPTLMAADVLVYHANIVPVGEDQNQHLELANDIAQKFNHDFGVSFFPAIQPIVQKTAARIMSLRDGTSKMSKSDPSFHSLINLKDTNDTIAEKIQKAKTDSFAFPDNENDLQNRPEARNLLTIYAALADTTLQDTICEFAGWQFAPFKQRLTEQLTATITPLREEMLRLLDETDHLDAVLETGAKRAIEKSTPVIARTKELMGFVMNA